MVVGVVALVACGKGDKKDDGKKDDPKGDTKGAKGDTKDQKGDKKADGVAKAKTMEAKQFLKKMYDGARAYYMEAGGMGGGMTPLPPQFPAPSQGPTPPLGDCCSQDGKCAPAADQWMGDVWTALMFSVDDPHYYSYSYITDDELTSFTVRANGDLDCDGEYSTFEMSGLINEDNPDGPSGAAEMRAVNELE